MVGDGGTVNCSTGSASGGPSCATNPAGSTAKLPRNVRRFMVPSLPFEIHFDCQRSSVVYSRELQRGRYLSAYYNLFPFCERLYVQSVMKFTKNGRAGSLKPLTKLR